MKFGIGQPVPRTEDPRFLKGKGRYVADILPPLLHRGHDVVGVLLHLSLTTKLIVIAGHRRLVIGS